MSDMMAASPSGEPRRESVGMPRQQSVGEPDREQTVQGAVAIITFTITLNEPDPPRDLGDRAMVVSLTRTATATKEAADAAGQAAAAAAKAADAAKQAATAAAKAADAAKEVATAADQPLANEDSVAAAKEASKDAQQVADEAKSKATKAEAVAQAAKGNVTTVQPPEAPTARAVLSDADLRRKLDDQQLKEELLAHFQKQFGRSVDVASMTVAIGKSVEIVAVISLAVSIVSNYIQIAGGIRGAVEETRLAFRTILRSITEESATDFEIAAGWHPGPALLDMATPVASPAGRQSRGRVRPRTPLINTGLLVILLVLVTAVLILLLDRPV
jgi:hypothetical protein